MQSVRLDDIEMHYSEAGSGPPLVMLHGLGGSWQDWQYQIDALAAQHRVIAPDLRGFGATPSGRHAPTVPRLADDVWRLLQALGIARFALMGHSMGGAVALQLALEHGVAVSRLVLVNSVPTFRPRSLRQHFEVIYRMLLMGIAGPRWLARVGAERMFAGESLAAVRADSIARGSRNSRRTYMSALWNLTRWSMVHRLKDLKMPALVVGSQHDYFTHEDTVRFAHGLGRGRMHVIEGAHHGLPQENPEALNRLLLGFLGREAATERAA